MLRRDRSRSQGLFHERFGPRAGPSKAEGTPPINAVSFLVLLSRGHWNGPTLRERQIQFHLKPRIINQFARKSGVKPHKKKFVKDGPKCKQTVLDAPSEDRDLMGESREEGGRVRHKVKQTMEELAAYLTIRLRQPVFDATGLTATYDIVLNFVQEPSGRGAAAYPDGGVVAAAEPPGGPRAGGAAPPGLSEPCGFFLIFVQGPGGGGAPAYPGGGFVAAPAPPGGPGLTGAATT